MRGPREIELLRRRIYRQKSEMAEVSASSSARDNPRMLPEEPMSEEEEEQEEVENSSASEYEDASDSESDGNDEDSEFMDFLSKLRGSTEIGEILNSDGHRSIPRIVEDYEAVVGITAITDTRKEGPSSLHPLPFINSLREVSSQLQTFQASPETPDGTA